LNDALPALDGGPRRRARFTRFQAWLGILLSLTCLTWLVYTTDWAGVWTALAQVDYWLVIAALLLNLASVLLRTARWRLMFRARRVPSFKRLVAALLVGQAVNVLAPARLGDLARATLAGTGEAAYTLGTLVVEIALDLLMLVALVLLLLSQVTLPAWWRGSGQALVAASAMALAAVVALVVGRRWVARALERLAARWRHPWMQRALAVAGQLLLSLDTLGRPAQLLPALGWSVLIWTLYGAVNCTLLGAVGERPSVLAALFLLAVLQLGVAVPSSPGRLGVFHYLCVQALAVFGVYGPQALSYAVILHLISVVVPMTMGAALAWRLGVQMWGTPDDTTVES
jgi:uncharacterized membrane protein YbhN (UPF0104 family)